MKMHIKEFAKLSGVTVRTLHYYDELGLLKPAEVSGENGYRYYDESSAERMQEILFFRELDFSLKSISEILSSPEYNRRDALLRHKQLLLLKKERLERIISAVDSAVKGENISMKAFDNTEYESARREYEREAKEKWGQTAAYEEYAERSRCRTREEQKEMDSNMDGLMNEFAICRKNGFTPESDEAAALVKKWQDFISENYYTCTKEILAGLGEMYSADERFAENIDRHGEGTAEFMSAAIREYCR